MNPHKISDYIENLPLQTFFCKGYRPDDVYEAICNLSSMYNQVLSEVYAENEELKREVELLKKTNTDSQSSMLNETRDQITESEEKVEVLGLLEEEQRDVMTNKELQRLKREELLEILLEQSKENEKLKLQLEENEKTIDVLNKKIADRKIDLQQAGTIAEASFKLNGVFDAAEKAAQQYLDNLKELYEKEKDVFEKKETDTELKCAAMMQATKERCDFMKEETTKNCSDMEEETTEKCRTMELEMTNKCQAMEAETTEKCRTMELEVSNRCQKMETEVTERCQALESDTTRKCQTMEEEATRKSEELTALTESRCRQREKEAEDKCIALDLKAKENVDKRWNELSKKLEDFYTAHQGIKELLSMSKM